MLASVCAYFRGPDRPIGLGFSTVPDFQPPNRKMVSVKYSIPRGPNIQANGDVPPPLLNVSPCLQ